MYRLLQTDDLESAALLKHRLLEADPDSPPSLVIVQSAHMQRWLSRLLSRSKGIWFQPDFATPDGGLRLLLADMKTFDGTLTRKSLFMDDLKYLSFRTLSREAAKPTFGESFPLLSQMLKTESQTKSTQFSRQRLYELADSLSGLYFNYAQLLWSKEPGQVADTHLFTLWGNNQLLLARQSVQGWSQKEQSLAAHEEWQQKLYKLMFPAERSYEILGYQTYRAATENWTYRGPYKRIILYGSTFLSSQAHAFFRRLAETGTEIEHILLTPSPALLVGADQARGLLGDWSALLQPFLQAAGQSGIVPDQLFKSALTPEKIHTSPLNLLRSTLKDQTIIPAALEPAQADGMWPDAGLRCFSCTTPLREVESLKQNLLALMASLRDSDKPLLPQEIAIMAPDIRRYRPYLEACFPSISADGHYKADHLPINLVDLDFGSDSAVITALELLLSLADSRLERSFVLELLDNPAIRLAMQVEADEVKGFRTWTEAYEVRWGLNAEHRQYLETGSSWNNTWDRALSRLFDDLTFGRVHVSSGELAAIGRIADYLHRTTLTLRSWSESRKTLQEWVRELQDFLDRSIIGPDESEIRILEQARSAAANLLQIAEDLMEKKALRDELDWTGFRILYRDQLAHLSGSRGQHQIDGISCSSLRPFRAISFRLIALLGMNEGDMPRRDDSVSFDLSRLEDRNRGLISNRLTDNYAWLETITSAQQWLWIFYTGRDPHNGEKLEPAPMVNETLSLLAKAGIPSSRLIVNERILAFDPEYFTPETTSSGLKNTDPESLDLAGKLLIAKTGNPITQPNNVFFSSVGQADLEFLRGNDGDGIQVSFKELLDFCCNPVRIHVRRRLGIYLDAHDLESDRDQEPLDPDNWLETSVVQAYARGLIEGDSDRQALAQQSIQEECQADRLFEGPFANRVLKKLEQSLELVGPQLSEFINPERASRDPAGHKFDMEQEFLINLPAPEGSDLQANLEIKRSNFRVRLNGHFQQLWQLDGKTVWVNVQNKATNTASSTDDRKYVELAIARAICRHKGLPIPQEIMVVSIHPKTKATSIIFRREFTSQGSQELELLPLLQTWLVNLVHPLPFYLQLSKGLVQPVGGLTQDDSSQDPNLELKFREAWTTEWLKLKPSHQVFGPAINPKDCPYFRLLTGSRDFIPPWLEWYSNPLEQVWLPLWHFRQSIVGKKSPHAGEVYHD